VNGAIRVWFYALVPSLLMWALIIAIAVGVAHADPPDPHIPNGASLWCPGGLGNVGLIPFCDGQRYDDGSFWHQTAASPFGFGGPASLPWTAPVLVTP
jgi:hypothetical protein